MINIENLTKKFGEITAVEGLTFQIKEGRPLGFLGPMVPARPQLSECFAA